MTKIIAVVGIDGAGKTTVVDSLSSHYEESEVACVKKLDRSNVNAVLHAFPQQADDASAYLQGEFAVALRWAHAFDFLRFYEQEVVSRYDRCQVILSDRWSSCSIAYAAIAPGIDAEIRRVLSCVRPADLYIYLDVTPDEGFSRIVRDRKPHGDEDLHLLEVFRQGYFETLMAEGKSVVTIPSTTTQETFDRIKSIVDQLLRTCQNG